MYTHISLDNLLSKNGCMALLTWLVKQESGVVTCAAFVNLVIQIAPNGGI